MRVNRLENLSQCIRNAYDTAKHYNQQKRIYAGGEEFLDSYINLQLKNFYEVGMANPQEAMQIKNNERYNASLLFMKKPSMIQIMKNRYMNMMMDFRIRMAALKDPELRKLKDEFENKLIATV